MIVPCIVEREGARPWERGAGARHREWRVRIDSECSASIGIGADDFTAVPAAQRTIGHYTETRLEEPHRSVAEEEVGTSGVLTLEAGGVVRETTADRIIVPIVIAW